MPQRYNSIALFGEFNMKDERRKFSYGSLDLVIASSGRLINHMHNTKGFTLEDIKLLVLDEADHLLEMGFKDELSKILL
jgi:ATP-dependent RNA helicase DDX18/HAS1